MEWSRDLRTFINFVQEKDGSGPLQRETIPGDRYCVSVSAVCGFSRLQRRLQIKGVERGSGDVSLTGNDVIDRLLLPLGEMLFRRQA